MVTEQSACHNDSLNTRAVSSLAKCICKAVMLNLALTVYCNLLAHDFIDAPVQTNVVGQSRHA